LRIGDIKRLKHQNPVGTPESELDKGIKYQLGKSRSNPTLSSNAHRKIKKTNIKKRRKSPIETTPTLSKILDISFSFLTPSLLAFRGINQQGNQQKDNRKEKTRWE
jgi:hypothetical protein